VSIDARAIVLAAGKGTRMKSRTPKVLHEICGRSMLDHVLANAHAAGAKELTAVVNADLLETCKELGLACVLQEPQNGTGHAVQMAMAAIAGDEKPVLIISADMPLVPSSLLEAVVAARHAAMAQLAFVTARVTLPTNFGRIIREGGKVKGIVENTDCSEEQRRVNEVNAGVYCFDSKTLREQLARLKPNNAQGELYLTDCVAGIAADGGRIETVECEDPRLVMGVNNRAELAAARAVMQSRILVEHMLAGVTIVDPAATYVDVGVKLEPDVTIFPQTHVLGRSSVGRGTKLGPGTQLRNTEIGEGCTVRWSVIEETRLGRGVTVGPFAHLRLGADVQDGAHIGNFVELKKTKMGRGSKAGHLSYLGDATIGTGVNIGAGTITCNWDGKEKHPTTIGDGAFIGSNSSLVAPIEIGSGALTGAGAVVTHDVPAGERVAGNPAKALPKKPK
jgi:bifunctional UDP-N-acetylglucosamine pyrophosphorylase/glucosamine-1-phosphate N-acetyltransferase